MWCSAQFSWILGDADIEFVRPHLNRGGDAIEMGHPALGMTALAPQPAKLQRLLEPEALQMLGDNFFHPFLVLGLRNLDINRKRGRRRHQGHYSLWKLDLAVRVVEFNCEFVRPMAAKLPQITDGVGGSDLCAREFHRL